VTQGIGRVERDGQPELERLKSRLEQVCESNIEEGGGMNVFRIPGLTLLFHPTPTKGQRDKKQNANGSGSSFASCAARNPLLATKGTIH
jgi:hypothetical protein